MHYSDGYLRDVLPAENPPLDFVPPDVEAEIQTRRGEPGNEDRELVARSTRWTYAMFRELSLRQFNVVGDARRGLMSPESVYVTIGLFDRDTEQSGLGIAVFTSGSKRPPFELIAYVDFPRLKRRFPLAARDATFEEHAPLHPVGATSTVWAKCNNSAVPGVLTAGHATLGTRSGQTVLFANGQSGVLSRSEYPVIDAAFVTVPGMPNGVTPMAILKFPAAGHKAVVELQTGPTARTVVSPGNWWGTNNTRVFMVWFLTDAPCAQGDSGALVRSPQGEAMGIYTHSLKTPAVPSGLAGFNQNYEQAAWALDITGYR